MTKFFVRAIEFLLVAALCTAAVGWSKAAEAANTATINFPAVTQWSNGDTITDPVTYNVYQGLEGQATIKVATIIALNTSVTTGLLTGRKYCWQVSAIALTIEGPKSVIDPVKSCKDFSSVPGIVTITVT